MKFKRLLDSQSINVSAVGSILIKFLSAFFAVLSGVLMARAMNLENYGYYVLAFATITILSVPVSLGLPTLIIRYISKYQINGEYSKIKGLLIRANQAAFFSFLIILFGAVVLYFLWWKKYDQDLTSSIWIGFILLLFTGLGSLRAAALRGLKYVVLGQIPDTFLRNLLLCSGISVYYFSGIKLLPHIAMWIHVASAGVSYLIGYVFLYKKLLIKLKDVRPEYHNKFWFKEALPFSFNSGIQVIRSKLVAYILTIFSGVEAVAIYDVATRGATLVSFTLDALNTAIGPYISSAFEKGNLRSLQAIVTKTSWVIFIGSLPVALVFIVGGEFIVGKVFGSDYQQAYIPLAIMCIGQLVNSATGSVGLVLSMTGNQGHNTRVNAYLTLLNVVICIPFVILWDVIGASILYSFLLTSQNVYLFFHVKWKLKINTSIFS